MTAAHKHHPHDPDTVDAVRVLAEAGGRSDAQIGMRLGLTKGQVAWIRNQLGIRASLPPGGRTLAS